MRTPKNYITNLSNGIITKEMLGMAIYSVNKRAKNYRDEEKYYREAYKNPFFFARHNYLQISRERKENLYDIKDEFLSFLDPSGVQTIIRQTYKGSKKEYYYTYTVGSFRFHHPISKKAYKEFIKNNPDIVPQKSIDLKTYGRDIHELLSLQFAKKILKVMQTGNYTLIDD